MQTFLPYPDFARSAAVLDPARLGKQRVETLQILRALELFDYGWSNHPAVGMWRGHTPALVSYGLACVGEWTREGRADATGPLIAEFAPQVVGRGQSELASAGLMPPWLGDERLHLSHRSALLGPARAVAESAGALPGGRRVPVSGGCGVWPTGPSATMVA